MADEAAPFLLLKLNQEPCLLQRSMHCNVSVLDAGGIKKVTDDDTQRVDAVAVRGGATTFPLLIFYSVETLPSTFFATLNGVDVSSMSETSAAARDSPQSIKNSADGASSCSTSRIRTRRKFGITLRKKVKA
ncbi:MAG TPA: hypothetical protein VFR24_19830 [Candidatus Angelobacter sp.]|nr:hypothetical protein [Candidatus Angelobacter sp.]